MASIIHAVLYDKRFQVVYLCVIIFATIQMILFDFFLGIGIFIVCLFIVVLDWADKYTRYKAR